MRLIAMGVGKGKTTKLIKHANGKRNYYIVTRSQETASLISAMAHELGMKINFPITYYEFINFHPHVRMTFGIDDIEYFVNYVSRTGIVDMITLTTKKRSNNESNA